jgi:CHAT domain-containing protein
LHLSRLTKRQATSVTLWALADPIFDANDPRAQGQPAPKSDPRFAVLRGASYERLQSSAAEVEAICKALDAPLERVLRDESALEARVKAAAKELATARYIHFATHGELGKDKTPQPRLVLGQVGNDDKEEMGGLNDGFLTLIEVTFLKLNAQVVTLSACETGKGRRDRGEGVSGLARAFLCAGSKGVACSLWSVDDARTAELMADFYKGLKEEKPTGEALRAAQLKMIRAGRAPFFWAPFILMGE